MSKQKCVHQFEFYYGDMRCIKCKKTISFDLWFKQSLVEIEKALKEFNKEIEGRYYEN